MAFSGNFMCTSFKKELLYGVHDFDLSLREILLKLLFTPTVPLSLRQPLLTRPQTR